ncbi:MAG: hypothetical protein NZ789_03160, partial [Pseudomonadales bacterium]|nr:hypothetical protein [Pseudomonadales bacterium]
MPRKQDRSNQPCETSDYFGFRDRALIGNIACIERSGRFKQHDLAFRFGDWFMLNATRHHKVRQVLTSGRYRTRT